MCKPDCLTEQCKLRRNHMAERVYYLFIVRKVLSRYSESVTKYEQAKPSLLASATCARSRDSDAPSSIAPAPSSGNGYGRKNDAAMPRSSEPYHAALRTAFSEPEDVSAPAPGEPGFCPCGRKWRGEWSAGRRRSTPVFRW